MEDLERFIIQNPDIFWEKNITIREDQITEISDSKFIVTSEKDAQVFYQVDMISGLCDCQAGLNRGPCKHKDAIAKYFNIAEFSVLPESDTNIRALYHLTFKFIDSTLLHYCISHTWIDVY